MRSDFSKIFWSFFGNFSVTVKAVASAVTLAFRIRTMLFPYATLAQTKREQGPLTVNERLREPLMWWA
jgi:hypothetical protein